MEVREGPGGQTLSLSGSAGARRGARALIAASSRGPDTLAELNEGV